MNVNIGIRREILILGHSKCEIWNLHIKISYISRRELPFSSKLDFFQKVWKYVYIHMIGTHKILRLPLSKYESWNLHIQISYISR